MKTPDLKVGSIVWVFDINQRRYKRDTAGVSVGAPIYREHWKAIEITGETSRSWVSRYWHKKIPKNGQDPDICFSLQELEDKIWIHDNHHGIQSKLSRVTDRATLEAVAKLIGYQAES